jgi:hypothetical protein
MKKLAVKFIVSIIALASVFTAIQLLKTDHQALTSGEIELILVDESGTVVYEEWITFEEGMTFYDVLQAHFELTCANASYQADDTCSYTFSSFGSSDKVILGIKGTTFELVTDWQHSYLSIYKWDGSEFRLTAQGVMQLVFEDQDRIKISVEEVW